MHVKGDFIINMLSLILAVFVFVIIIVCRNAGSEGVETPPPTAEIHLDVGAHLRVRRWNFLRLPPTLPAAEGLATALPHDVIVYALAGGFLIRRDASLYCRFAAANKKRAKGFGTH